MARRVATIEELSGLARAALGTRARLIEVSRLRGGTRKGVYRLTMDDASTAIAYLWDDGENYWPIAESPADELTNPFAAATGLDLFEAAHRLLTGLGVRVPRRYLIDRSQEHYPADAVVLEDVPGEHLEALLARDPDAAQPVLARLADALAVMHGHAGPAFGKVALINSGGVSRGVSGEQIAFDRALVDLAEVARRDVRIRAVRDRLEDVVRQLFARVRPRAEFGLIHGELGADHVLVDAAGQPVLIDIEGLMYFDIEWEHVFLELRFGEHYHRLERPGLDPARLMFYRLAMRLSLVAGPLLLLDGDFPDRAFMLHIAESNLRQVLTFLP
ncbi:MAG TPA: phosphotransferase [Kineosporiaceae bacterium]|nr:phosphotransferase [Kineosporiaceae bacterium]